MTSVQGVESAVSRLVAAAGSDPRTLLGTIDDVGAGPAADVVADEMRSRAGPSPDPGVRVVLRAGHDDVVTERALAGPTGTGDPDAVVEQDLAELVAALFGPRGPRPAATRRIRWRDLGAPAAFGRTLPVQEVVHRLLDGADRPYAPGLAELCVRHGSDKWGIHQYPRHYETHFGPRRDRAMTVVELGVGGFGDPMRGGASLRVWKRYFPRALVYGLDVVDKSALSEPRMTILAGDQSSPADLERLLSRSGPPDVVIDDGSHVNAHQLASFEFLFPVLRPGGLYVIEDLQTSYWPAFGGHPDATGDRRTAIGHLVRLVDGLHHEEIDGRVPRWTDGVVGGLHVHHNLAVVEKAANADGGAPAWIPRR